MTGLIAGSAVGQGGDSTDGANTWAVIGSSEVRVSEYLTVDIVAQNDNVINILQKLAIQARRNIVPSNNVDQIVNATIHGVPLLDALTGLLHPNGLGFVVDGEFIYVYTAKELAGMNLDPRPIETKVIHIDYLRSEDAKTLAEPLLSDRGFIGTIGDKTKPKSTGLAKDIEAAMGAAVGRGESGANKDQGTYLPETDKYSLANAIVVHDYAENIAAIESFVREADTQPEQVLIEVTIISTAITEDNAFGVDYALVSGGSFLDFLPLPIPPGFASPPLARSNPTVSDGGALIANPGHSITDPTLRVGITYNNMSVLIQALDRVSDTVILSNPKVLALNRQPARIHVGNKTGYQETTLGPNQTTIQTIKFLDDGIELKIRPFVLRDGRIRLEVSPSFSATTLSKATGIPSQQIQVVTTNVLVPAGYIAVIGGLFQDKTVRDRSQVPLAGDLPLVGWAFRGHIDSVARIEVMFLIKPTVLKDRVLIEQGKRGGEYRELIRIGSRLGLLPWSRDRRSWKLNLKAERLAAEGKIDKALYNLRRSRELNPLQPYVLQMQEELTGKREWWPVPTWLDKVIGLEHGLESTEEAPEPPPAATSPDGPPQ